MSCLLFKVNCKVVCNSFVFNNNFFSLKKLSTYLSFTLSPFLPNTCFYQSIKLNLNFKHNWIRFNSSTTVTIISMFTLQNFGFVLFFSIFNRKIEKNLNLKFLLHYFIVYKFSFKYMNSRIYLSWYWLTRFVTLMITIIEQYNLNFLKCMKKHIKNIWIRCVA